MLPLPSPTPDTCFMVLVRHGATDNNRAVPPRLQGRRTDPGLSEEGRHQADRLENLLADWPLGRVFASPLRRARETAEPVARRHGLEVVTVDELIEVDVGQWEGRAWDEIEKSDPDAYRGFMEDPTQNPYLGGENVTVVQERVVPAVSRLMSDNAGRLIAVVAHNVVNRTFLAHLLDVPLRKYRSIPQSNCGLNLIRMRRGKLKLMTVNLTLHLS